MWIAVIFFCKAKLYKTITRLSLQCVGIHVIGSSRKEPLPTEVEQRPLTRWSSSLLFWKQNLFRNSMKFIKKYLELLYDPAFLPWILIQKHCNQYSLTNENISTSLFIAAQFPTAKMWKQLECLSMDEWVQKICVQTVG